MIHKNMFYTGLAKMIVSLKANIYIFPEVFKNDDMLVDIQDLYIYRIYIYFLYIIGC